MNKKLTFKNEQNPSFEINLVVRDVEGNPISRRSYKSDEAFKIWEFYQRNKGKPKNKRRKKSEKLPSKNEAAKLVVEAAEYAEQKQQQRNGD